jgi:hypothetical protein
LTAGTTQPTVQDAFNADNIIVNPGDIIIYTWSGSAYVYTGPTGTITSATPAQFTSLGATVSFATAAEIFTGTEDAKAIAPDQLQLYALDGPTGGGAAVVGDAKHLVLLDGSGQIAQAFIPNADATDTHDGTLDTKFLTPADLRSVTKNKPGGTGGAAQAADADYLVRLDASGHIDSGFISFTGLTYRGNLDVTGPYNPPSGLKAGDFATVKTAGVANGGTGATNGWPGFSGTEKVAAGDMILWDGTNWHLVSHAIDTSAYVNRAGPNTIQNDMVMTWTPPATLATIIDGGDPTKSRIDSVLLDCGTF